MVSDELRQSFLRFFEDKRHRIIPSSSLVPHGDPTLLLTSAGMVQVKPYFLGLATPPSRRLASCQKCFRTTDIDSVGDNKHLTFFEMLGNFSVGDYFKKEAIAWAWEFVTRYLKLPEERLWITVYLDDDESFVYWQQLGVPTERILRFGDEDNFWGPAGDSGPCGPCSEIHYDLGKDFGCGSPECKPNCSCTRFSEIWNLVFTQYNQDRDGHRTPLPRPNIDTGMGLERTLAAIQNKSSPYETDLFSPLINELGNLTGKEYGKEEGVDRAMRIVVEHSRGIAFLIADGVMPSNEGRGYVLRRILRRASLFGRRLGLNGPFLKELAGPVMGEMKHVYPELVANQTMVTEVIESEESRFLSTLETGLALVGNLIDDASKQKRNYLSGEEVFKLYDTYGFPKELTAEMAREKGLSLDLAGFEAKMEKQRERARSARTFDEAGKLQKIRVPLEEKDKLIPKREDFVGYDKHSLKGKVVNLVLNANPVMSASREDEVDITLDKTPFYGEMGGQVGDTGEIVGPNGTAVVSNTFRSPSGTTIHRAKVIQGSISLGEEVEARVDSARRLDIARNHTATHLLQAALKQIVGNHVQQKGSLVEPERFRFDFPQLLPLSQEELSEIQRWLNERIRQNLAVRAKVVSYDEAIAQGAIALFEEKYGDMVRLIEIGEPAVSKELCGGTHVGSTGEIGIFLITGESSIGTGLRRIEAVTGKAAESLINTRFSYLQRAAEKLESPWEKVPDKVQALAGELEEERKRSLLLERELSQRMIGSLLERAGKVNEVTVVAARLPSLTMAILRETGDILRDKLKSAVIVLATVCDGKPNFLAMVTPDLVDRGLNAGDIVKQVAKVAGGGGGGKANMAQGSGRDASKVDEALNLVKGLIAKQVSSSSM